MNVIGGTGIGVSGDFSFAPPKIITFELSHRVNLFLVSLILIDGDWVSLKCCRTLLSLVNMEVLEPILV
jgi:hypothetical protein